jgi:hypothetical protein
MTFVNLLVHGVQGIIHNHKEGVSVGAPALALVLVMLFLLIRKSWAAAKIEKAAAQARAAQAEEIASCNQKIQELTQEVETRRGEMALLTLIAKTNLLGRWASTFVTAIIAVSKRGIDPSNAALLRSLIKGFEKHLGEDDAACGKIEVRLASIQSKGASVLLESYVTAISTLRDMKAMLGEETGESGEFLRVSAGVAPAPTAAHDDDLSKTTVFGIGDTAKGTADAGNETSTRSTPVPGSGHKRAEVRPGSYHVGTKDLTDTSPATPVARRSSLPPALPVIPPPPARVVSVPPPARVPARVRVGSGAPPASTLAPLQRRTTSSKG